MSEPRHKWKIKSESLSALSMGGFCRLEQTPRVSLACAHWPHVPTLFYVILIPPKSYMKVRGLYKTILPCVAVLFYLTRAHTALAWLHRTDDRAEGGR